MKSLLLSLCDTAVVDQQSKQVSLINLIEGVKYSTLPIILPRMTIVSWVERKESEPSKMTLLLELFQGRKNLLSQNIPIDFKSGLRARQIFELNGFTINSKSNIQVRVSHESKRLDNFLLLVTPHE